MKHCVYKVSGMHCSSCEILIEKKLLDLPGVRAADASLARGEVAISSEDEAPDIRGLNKIFAADRYVFSEGNDKEEKVIHLENIFKNIFIAGIIIAALWWFKSIDFGRFANVTSNSSLPAFFVMGLIAGVSTCAALSGGIMLSMSKQWAKLYNPGDSFFKKSHPPLMFVAGRTFSYAFFGAILGILGSKLQLSAGFSSFLVLAVSALMLVLGLDMLGVPGVGRLKPILPKSITRRIADEKKFSGRYMPFIMGGLTFFISCGFTITAQGSALLSGSILRGGLIMLMFALGTAPALLVIGFSGIKFTQRPHWAASFNKVAGILVLLFALYNINAQMTALGWGGFAGKPATDGFAQIIDGKQILKMNASSRGYSPDYFKIKSGVPVRWEITDTGTSGCTNAVIARGLFDGQIDLLLGKTSVKEFVPKSPGRYRFSCWMGMVSGVIEVL